MSEKHDAMWGAEAGEYIAQQEAEIERLRTALERALENIANRKVPRQNIAGPIRAALAKTKTCSKGRSFMKEPMLPIELEDDDKMSAQDWTVKVLLELARQLGVMNDYYYPLIGAAGMIKNRLAD